MPLESWAPSQLRDADTYRATRIAHWQGVASAGSERRGPAWAYHRRLAHIYRFLVPPGLRVLELGCSDGELLDALQPAVGVGVDFSPGMIENAKQRHSGLQFVEADAHDLSGVTGTFDVILLSDLLHDVWDVQGLLTGLPRLCHPGTRLIMNFYSRLWELPLTAARRVGLAREVLKQNWLTVSDVTNLLSLSDFRVVRAWQEVLFPFSVPLVAPLCNRVLVRLWGLRHLALANFVMARPLAAKSSRAVTPRVSVVVPARNEAGNVSAVFSRTPEMGSGTELIFVEGHSSDDTYGTIQAAIAAHPRRQTRLLRQTGRGKGDAVRAGFAVASGEILMILDADLHRAPGRSAALLRGDSIE